MKIISLEGNSEYRDGMVDIVKEAFYRKFHPFLGKGNNFNSTLREIINLNMTYGYIEDNKILGVMLLKEKKSSTFTIKFNKLVQIYGILRGFKVFVFLQFIFGMGKLDDSTLKIEILASHKESRGKGIGTKLLNKAEIIAKKRGYNRIKLEVIDVNPRAKKLYEELGYISTKYVDTHRITKKSGFNGFDEMEKKL